MQEKNVLTLSSGSLQKFANSFLRSYRHGCVKKLDAGSLCLRIFALP